MQGRDVLKLINLQVKYRLPSKGPSHRTKIHTEGSARACRITHVDRHGSGQSMLAGPPSGQ
jgi:hypothetical protein